MPSSFRRTRPSASRHWEPRRLRRSVAFRWAVRDDSRMAKSSRLPGRSKRKPALGEAPIPIARLLAMAFRSLVDELHERLAERGIRDLRPAYGFVLLAARREPVGVGDVGVLLGTTKQ